jgi:hypothetical protein
MEQSQVFVLFSLDDKHLNPLPSGLLNSSWVKCGLSAFFTGTSAAAAFLIATDVPQQSQDELMQDLFRKYSLCGC